MRKSIDLTIIILILCAGLRLNASENDTTRIVSRVSAELSGGFVPSTSSFFRGDNKNGSDIREAMSANIKYSFSFARDSRQWRHFPGAYQGLGVGFNSFFHNDLLGSPIGVYLFQGAPVVRLTQRLSFGYEWNFGASFGWRKCSESDQQNIVGTSTNAYLNLSLMMHYRLSPTWQISAGLSGSHFSNGNTKYPNSGVNTIGLRLGLTYTIDGEPFDLASPSNEGFKPGFSYDLTVYGATRSKGVAIDGTGVVLPGSFGVAGINFAVMRDFHRLFRFGLSVDTQYDESAGISDYLAPEATPSDPLFYRPPFGKSISVGLSARAEFVMPIFTVAVGYGRNFTGPSDVRAFYQTLSLKTFVWRDLYQNVGYQLHSFKNPNNLMLGFGYRFHSGR